MSKSTTAPGNQPDILPLPTHISVADPLPLEPERPLPMECCDSGCDSCVHDVYADEVNHYRKLLRAWKERNPESAPR